MHQLSETESAIATSQPFNASQVILQYLQEDCAGYLVVTSGDMKWFIYIDQGQLKYITHSIDPLDRLDCHLRGMSRRIPAISAEIRTEVRLSLDPDSGCTQHLRPDYRGIASLIQDGILSAQDGQILITEMSREALESLLLAKDSTYHFRAHDQAPAFVSELFSNTPTFDLTQPLELDALLQDCHRRIQDWQTLAPHIVSPYQRPYFFSQSQDNSSQLTAERQQRLGKLLRGFSFRHLAILIDQDELKLAKSLYPLILDKIVLLREPQPPYDVIPGFVDYILPETVTATPVIPTDQTDSGDTLDVFQKAETVARTHRVACIDDSPIMLQTIERFLGAENISVSLIQDSVKALVELMRIKPDLVLMDVGMPKVNGYELCRLLRKHPLFKTIPIIMVTGNTGLIDRAKAKVSGATDYMTKPFNQDDLLKMVFRYLT